MNQRGMALIAGLVLLAAFSLLALVATSGMILQRHMAANYHENDLALENAAIASFFATSWLYSRPNYQREAGCITGCLLPAGIHNAGEIPTQAEFQSAGWWLLNGIAAGIDPYSTETVSTGTGTGANPPLWIMEELYFEATETTGDETNSDGVAYYRILSRGTGTQAGKVAVTESIVARPWGGDYQLGTFPADAVSSVFCLQFAGLAEGNLDCGRLAWRQRR